DEVDVAADHGERPDRDIVAQHHVADHAGGWIDIGALAEGGQTATVGAQNGHYRVHAAILGPRRGGPTTLGRMDTIADTQPTELAPTLQRLRDAWQARKPDYAQRRDDLQRLR